MIENLLLSKNSVFTLEDIRGLWGTISSETFKQRIYRLTKKNDIKLIRIRKGVFIIEGKDYNSYECANKLNSPSYISFETVLFDEGLIFQRPSSILSSSLQTKKIIADLKIYNYRKIKKSVLLNNIGIEFKDNYYVATKERALLDYLYVNGISYFDNLRSIDFVKAKEIVLIYEDLNLEKQLKKLCN